jgi:site-specific DNA-methyltransferase (adenine-specific)
MGAEMSYKRKEVIGDAVLYLGDCLEIMPTLGKVDLAIVDPPYGIARFGNRVELSNRLCDSAKLNTWDVKPTPEYFEELQRVSGQQIIWGANNFTLPETEYFIVWDKKQTVDNFASAEYAWTNCKMPAKVFRYSIHQEMATRKKDGGKIHPTQKPVALYRWLLKNYAKEGDHILDTHGGSMSSVIACLEMGFKITCIEIDEDYFNAGCERVRQANRQGKLFTPPKPKPEQGTLL